MSARDRLVFAPLTLCIASIIACSQGQVSERVEESRQPASARLTTLAAAVQTADSVTGTVPGYVHTLECSRFGIGQGVTLEVNVPTFQRWRGSHGAFAMDPTNFSVGAILNADAPTGPYILDVPAHNSQVRQYFTGCGLPDDQVAGVDTTYNVVASGSRLATQTHPTLRSVTSILRRSVGGVPVPDSRASATLTTAGGVDAESVFWPPLSAATVESAVAFASTLANSDQSASYLANIPNVDRVLGVVIHHSSAAIHSAPVAYVSLDVLFKGATTIHHFDVNGNEFKLPQEARTMTDSVR